MSRNHSGAAPSVHAPRPTYSPARTIAAAAVVVAAVLGLLAAVAVPTAAATAVAVALAGGLAIRAVRDRLRRRRATGRSRTVCLPAADVCVEA